MSEQPAPAIDPLFYTREDGGHEHVFSSMRPGCMFCGVTMEELRRRREQSQQTQAFDRMTEVYERLVVVLERLERKL